jgi:hypothetical protein
MLAVSVALGTFAANAQTSRGTVTGVVTDATRASVPGATVEIINKETSVVRTTETNEQGVYRFDAVDPGTWDVVVKSTGFKTYTSRAIPVSAAQTAGVNAVLEIGDAVTSIEVYADALALQTEAPVRGGTITAVQATQLPLSSRNPNMLAITLPGVTEQRSDLPGISTFSANGSRGRSNNFLLDGTENNDISLAGQAFQVRNPDAVQEVSVQTSNYDAEFGRAGGAVVNTITKSGTNQFHGTLGWVADFTNDDAVTNTLSLDPKIQARGKLPPGYDQYYNGTAGGPLSRNRTFFFTSWQEQRRRATNSTTFVVPSALGRQQILRAAPQGANPRADLYLDVTKHILATGQYTDVDLGPGRGNAQFGTGVLSYPYKIDGRQILTKIDHSFSDKDLLSFRHGFDRTENPTAGVNFPGFFTSQRQQYHNFLLTETHIFSPTLTNELRIPFNRILFEFPNDASDPRAATMPVYTFTGIDSIGISGNFPQGRIANNYQLQDTMNWVRGKHSLRFGLDLLSQRSRQSAPVYIRGQLDYRDSNFAGQRFSSFANFLDDFGGAGAASRDFGSPVYYPELFRQAYFIQDRWQMRDNVTLTLGLRWEDFGTPANSLRTPAYAGLFNVTVDRATGRWTAPMTEPNRTDRDLNNFAPNFGLTWSPRFDNGPLATLFGDRKSVLRTGYMIGYDSFFNNIASNAASSAPNMITTSIVSAPDAENVRGIGGLSQMIPSTPRAVLPVDAQNLVVKNLKNPYYQRWSFGIQREMPWGMVADVSYVGSSGTGLYINEDLNPQVLDPELRVLPTAFSSLSELQTALPPGYKLQARLDPLQGSRTIRTNGGHSSYHSGQFQLSKRFTKDCGFSAAYTWSKLLDNGSEIFTFNNSSSLAAIPSVFGGQRLERAVSLYDRPHRFVLTWNYMLPWMRSQQGTAGRVLGGWQVAGITTFESGVPLNVSNGADADGIGGAGDRPDLNPAGRAGVRARPDASSPTGYVNPDVLVNGKPAPIDPLEARYIGLPANSGRTGTAGRNTERTPGIRNVNLNLFKDLRLTERLNLEFRTELYNVLNHPQYGYPSVSPFTPGGGTPASNVTGSLSGRFLGYQYLDGGGRTVRYQLTLRF